MVGGGASHTYGSVATAASDDGKKQDDHNLRTSLKSLKDASSRVAFLESTRTHHHPTDLEQTTTNLTYDSPSLSSGQYERLGSDMSVDDKNSLLSSHSNLRKIALDFSLWINVAILVTKVVAYFETLSLSILAALVDSILDVVSSDIFVVIIMCCEDAFPH